MPSGQLRVLIIERDKTSAEMIARELERAHLIETWDRVNTEGKFIKALIQKPDLIVADYSGADLPSSRVLDILSERKLETPVVVVTDDSDRDVAIASLKQGAYDCLTKGNLIQLPQSVKEARKKAAERIKQKRMERALMLTKFAVDHASISIYWVSMEGRFMWVNEAGLTLLGYTLKELSALNIEDVDPALSGAAWIEFSQQIRTQLSLSKETRFQHKDGHFIPVECTANYFHMEGQEYILLFSRDTSERKKAESEHARLVIAVEQAEESIMITDVEGKILYVNPAFERVTGYDRDEILGQTPKLIKSGKHNRAFYNELWGKLTSGESWRGEFVNRKKDGTLYQEEATISPIKDTSGKITNFVAVKRDVTDEVYLKRQVNQTQKMEAIGRLAGGVAHDFNNLLTIINGYAELMMKETDQHDPFYKNLQQINKAIKRGSNLTRQLLAFSRRQPLEARVMDVNGVFRDMLTMMKRLLGEDIHLETHLDENVGNIKADPGQIEQIVVNLAVNARDAMPDGGKLVVQTGMVDLDASYCETRINVTPGRHVMLSIADNGQGMNEEVKQKIFEPFFTTKDSGTGLGLSTVFGIVQQNDGHIECFSEPDEGTEFKIYFPVVDEPVQEEKEQSLLESLPRGTERILLVEDEEDVRSLAARMLRLQGYEVMEAQHGGEAFLACEREPEAIDLLITDVIMPHMSGAQLADRLKSLKPKMKVLYMSGYASNVIASQAPDKTEISFLSKPFTLEEISRKVRDVLDS